MIVRMDMPDPAPWSGNCDVVSFWGGGSATASMSPMSTNTTRVENTAIPEISSTTVNAGATVISQPVAPSGFGNEQVDLIEMDENGSNSMYTGEFGLLPAKASANNVAGNVNKQNDELDEMYPANVSVMSPSSYVNPEGTNKVEENVNKPLVNFLGGQSLAAQGMASNSMISSVKTEPVVENVTPALVSFNSGSQISNMTNNDKPITSNPTVANGANIMAAPVVNINSFMTDNNSAADEEIVRQNLGMVSNFTNSENGSSKFVTLNANDVPTKKVVETASLNDTFGKPDFVVPNNASIVNPNMVLANAMAAQTDNMFNVPSDMNLAGDGGEPPAPTSEDKLINFLENMG